MSRSRSTKRRTVPLTARSSATASIASRGIHKSSSSSASAASSTSSSSSSKLSLQGNALIRRVHQLNRQLSLLPEADPKRAALKEELESLGGIDAYQKASIRGAGKQRGGDTSKFLVKWMLELDLKQRQSAVTAGETAATETAAAETTASNGGKRLRLLDVGAVSPDNYVHQSKWVDCTPIDLNPQDERIIKLDILDTPSLKKLLASSAADGATIPDVDGMPQFDVVCLSLVLNFGGDIEDRGRILEQAVRMLQHSASHGLLYIVLPLPCLSNSRYFSQQKLDDILRDAFGFKRIRQHESKALAYSLYQREVAPPKASTRAKFPKAIVEDGPGRNNFVIVVK